MSKPFAQVKLEVRNAVAYAVFTSIDGGRPAFIDGNALVHEELSRLVALGAGPMPDPEVGVIGGYRATTYRHDDERDAELSWTVTVIEAPR